MKHVSRSATEIFENGPGCTVFEYGGDKDISGAVAVINGRYPDSGWAVNEVSKEVVYVVSGSGTFYAKGTTIRLKETDMVLVDIHEPYYIEGTHLHIFMSTTPAWTPEQHKQLPL